MCDFSKYDFLSVVLDEPDELCWREESTECGPKNTRKILFQSIVCEIQLDGLTEQRGIEKLHVHEKLTRCVE